MTDVQLAKWERSRRRTYVELSQSCGSVQELLLKIAVYGQKWAKWDWVLFFMYLVDAAMFDFPPGALYGRR